MAFYCCGIRAEEAQAAPAATAGYLCRGFHDQPGVAEFNPRFRGHGDARTKSVNVVRSRIFQDEIARRLKADKDLQIVNIGAGFTACPPARRAPASIPTSLLYRSTRTQCVLAETCGNPGASRSTSPASRPAALRP